MLRMALFLTVFVGATVSVVDGQTSTNTDARALLVELGRMLEPIPEKEEECQALLQRIREWQRKKLDELAKQPLAINAPRDKSQVGQRPVVEGTVSDRDAEVWVIVHPMEVGDYWVQPRPTVRGDETWKTQIHIGRPGPVDVGKHFEIMAVANPRVKLEQGKVLPGWPEAEWKSQVVEVTRK